MYRIGEFSKLAKTTVKTLRHYDEQGLLIPASVDRDTGYRLYSTEQLARLSKIIAYRQAGLSLEEIGRALDGDDLPSILRGRLAELSREQESVNDRINRIQSLIAHMKEEYFMEYQAVTKELPECIVYSKRMVVPDYDAYFSIIPELGEEVRKHNPDLKCVVPEYSFIVYHAGEYREKDIDMEYCEAVDKFGVEFDDVIFKKMESVPAVCVMHKGPYSGLGKAYAYAFKFIEENGFAAADNPRESYIDGIWNKEDEAEWLTEVQIPVKRR